MFYGHLCNTHKEHFFFFFSPRNLTKAVAPLAGKSAGYRSTKLWGTSSGLPAGRKKRPPRNTKIICQSFAISDVDVAVAAACGFQ